MNKIEDNDTQTLMSPKELALLGEGEVAYIKQVDSDAAELLFPAIDDTPQGIELYAVLGADGSPIALADSRNAAIANAIENDLVLLSVH